MTDLDPEAIERKIWKRYESTNVADFRMATSSSTTTGALTLVNMTTHLAAKYHDSGLSLSEAFEERVQDIYDNAKDRNTSLTKDEIAAIDQAKIALSIGRP